MMEKIPFNKPAYIREAESYLTQALLSAHLAGDGPFTKRSAALLESKTGAKKALLTTSCTHALEMAAILLDLKPGDEVIVPSFTFVSTVNAIVLRGAKPVFIDIRPDTLNFDERRLEKLITPKTKAFFVVHYAGIACEMDMINQIASKYGIMLLKTMLMDFLGLIKGKILVHSEFWQHRVFMKQRMLVQVKGGALLVNDLKLEERAEIIREKGTDRSRYFRGQIDKYTWVDIGSSYLPSELIAAVLLAQLEASDQIQAKRTKIWNTYQAQLSGWAEKNGVRLPYVPEYCCHPSHMFYMIMPDFDSRTRFIEWMKSQDITCVFHYLPLHLSTMGRKFGGKEGDCPVTEDISDRLVRLPLFYDLSEKELDRVVDSIKRFSWVK